jgi:hypothetical protein
MKTENARIVVLEFPGSRENNREFCEFLAIGAFSSVNSRGSYGILQKDSLAIWNWEFSSRDQGIVSSGTRNSSIET